MTLDNLIHGGWYWLHCIGPDGPVVLLVRHYLQRGCRHVFEIPEDGRDCETPCATDEGLYLHKWRMVRLEPLVRPSFKEVS